MRNPSIAESTEDFSKRRGSQNDQNIHKSPATRLGKLGKEVFTKRDIFGRTILHICALANDAASLRHVLRAGESKNILSATDYENGWNILHYIFYHKRLRCLNVLVTALEGTQATISPILIDLLKKKDRNGSTPLSLLQNDAKDLFWIPQYINEKNKFHLVRRFAESAISDENTPTTTEIDTSENQPANQPENQAANINRAPNDSTKKVTSRRTVGHDWWCETRGGSDVYVLGVNANNNLGVGDSHDRTYPTQVNRLINIENRKNAEVSLREALEKPRYRFIKMSKYHSVLGTTDGKVFTCGIGSRGRLGHGNASNSDYFKEVAFPTDYSPVMESAVSNNHTVVLTSSGTLFGWGSNTLNQLGFTSTAPYNSFKTIADVYENAPVEISTGDLRRKTSPIKGIEVSKIHSVAYTSQALYFWGLNVGQIVLPQTGEISEHRVSDKTYKGVIVPQPKEVQMREEIKLVATCETCTCVVTVSNDIYLFYSGQRVKLPKLSSRVGTETHFDFFKPSCLTSAPSVKKVVMKFHNSVHLLLESGDVMTFSVTSTDIKSLRSTRYTYAWSPSEVSMRAVDIDNAYDGSLVVCTRNGSVLIRSNQAPTPQRRGSSSANMASFSFSPKKKFKKLEGINRVVRVVCNDTFSSFAFLKDDIDSLPFKLQRNDFFKDMEYLTPFMEPDLYRKQDQLLDTDHDMNCYITDFIYPLAQDSGASEDDRLLILNKLKAGFASFEEKEEQVETTDLLRKRMLQKFSTGKNKEPTIEDIFQKISPSDLKSHSLLLKTKIDTELLHLPYERQREKFGDGKIEFEHLPNFSIGIHTDIFRKRSKLCEEIFSPKEAGEYFVHQKIRGAYNPETRSIVFQSNVEPLAVLVFVYFVYTNTLIDFWQDYTNTDPNINLVRRVKSDFLTLMTLFKMDILFGKDDVYLDQLQGYSDDANADVLIALSGGDTVTCSSSIISRSAFFETILSGRWENNKMEENQVEDELELKYVGLEEIGLLHMKVILAHLQGCHDLHVFDEAKSVVSDSRDSDDFVNFLLEMIEVADELLLVQLKHLSELAIKEFINIDNVLILLGHADWSGARKLFMSCCWYIYNNLELVVFDQNLRDLDDKVLVSIEVQMQLLDKCKHPQFVVGSYGEIDWNVINDTSGLAGKDLVESFVKEMSKFNELFMSDAKGYSSFEPLIDIKSESSIQGDERRKSANRRMSSKGTGDVLAEVQKLAILSGTRGSQSQGRRQSDYSAIKEDDCAIDDGDEFEVVTNRRRKSKSRLLSDRHGETSAVESSSREQIQANAIPRSLPKEEQVIPRRPSETNRKVLNAPVLGPVLGDNLNPEKKQTKIKFAPSMKLSQKERRKVRSDTQTTVGSSSQNGGSSNGQAFRNPWNVPKPETGNSTGATKGPAKINALPVLGQKEAPAPKLSAIILEEATRLAEEKEPVVTKTLQEIQQEQEFAKWWEEECKRVQQLEAVQMGQTGSSRDTGGPHSTRTEPKRGGKSKRGRGRRGG